jgi:1-acyl-sn-glycerol-3-phosphate acyltransferase
VDVYAILATTPARFVAKAEIRSWPMVGRLVEGVGTLFLERKRNSHAHQTGARIADAIRSGDTIAICPEGTTSVGDVLLPFHAALFQPAVETGARVQPLALRYLDRQGNATQVAAYIDGISLVGSLWRIVGEGSFTVELSFAPPVTSAGKGRRALARECEEAIARALSVAVPQRRERGRALDPPAAPR